MFPDTCTLVERVGVVPEAAPARDVAAHAPANAVGNHRVIRALAATRVLASAEPCRPLPATNR